ncbi:hypothetical protein SR41_11020 [Sphingomonas melonis]|uniref:Uncharacterized protein n=1 Tax=Sphingomonas melonis TaxID=152682 RepID=A0A0D1M968_9SPHN|nr:hypothetical protein [Sphingomonas melonis]KIU27217.1 hypothetical protein SR41_11020 [Sphingomonas melonis]
MIDLNRPQPDFAAISEAANISEWAVPALIADIYTDGDDDDHREIDRHLARLRRQGEADHAAMIHSWTFGPPAL